MGCDVVQSWWITRLLRGYGAIIITLLLRPWRDQPKYLFEMLINTHQDTRFHNTRDQILRAQGAERETNKLQLIWCLLSNFYLNMFRASLCPSSGEQECALPHMVFCAVSDGCGCVELGRKLCALWRSLFEQWPSCWDKSLIINIRLVASCWSHSLHPISEVPNLCSAEP